MNAIRGTDSVECEEYVGEYVFSRFVFATVKCKEIKYVSVSDTLEYDDEGDVVVNRKDSHQHILTLEHCTSTPLSLVGLQIWCGSFVLADYLLFLCSDLKDKLVLELGAGTGICSIVASMFAKHVFSTDFNQQVLSLCQKNVSQFYSSWNSVAELNISDTTAIRNVGNVSVKHLDWNIGVPCMDISESPYGWTEYEKNSLTKVSVFLASDVIYDDDVTDMFFKTVIYLMEHSAPSTLYLSLEKRVNFIVQTLSPASLAYDYFEHHVDMVRKSSGKFNWIVQRIEVDFPQFFPYERNSQLELWKFQVSTKAFKH